MIILQYILIIRSKIKFEEDYDQMKHYRIYELISIYFKVATTMHYIGAILKCTFQIEIIKVYY